MPQVTVLMATWNRAQMIRRAIESVQAQTFKDWELVIVDDGSSDNTKEVVEEWQKRIPPKDGQARIVFLSNDVNQGISKTYNKGLRAARGKYVAMIDDDDPWADEKKLEKQVAFLEKNPEYVGCGAGVIVVDGSGKEMYRYFKPATDGEIRKYMLFSNPMANSTTMFRREEAVATGLYDEGTRYSGDRDFWLKLGLRGKLCNFKEYFSYYTMTGGNTSIARMRPHLKASLMIMKRYKGKYPHYYPALLLNTLQYWYSFLPEFIRRALHVSLARLKRALVG